MLKPYEENINKIKEEVYEIGQNVIQTNKIALSALKENDMSMMKDISLSISKVSEKSNEIDNIIVKTLALYSPEAKDLRLMVAYLKITNEVVRVAANTRMFIKQFKKAFTNDLNKKDILEYTIPLLKSANEALILAIAMIKIEDEALLEQNYQKVCVEEDKTDDLYAMVSKNLLKLITKKQELSKDYFEIMSALRRLEKVADRAASIANLLVFAKMGGEIGQS
jgi:phosphate transport system protein